MKARAPRSTAELYAAFQAGNQPKCSRRGDSIPNLETCQGYFGSPAIGCAVAEEAGQLHGAIIFKRTGQVEWLFCKLTKWSSAAGDLLAFAKLESGGVAPFGTVEADQARALFANEPTKFLISGEVVTWLL